MGTRAWFAGSLAAVLLMMCVEASAAGGAVTFSKDVLPILQKNCQACHRPGNIAPMSFLSYETARPWAKAMKAAVVTRKRSEEHTSELQSRLHLVCRLLLEKKKKSRQGRSAFTNSRLQRPLSTVPLCLQRISDHNYTHRPPLHVGDALPSRVLCLRADLVLALTPVRCVVSVGQSRSLLNCVHACSSFSRLRPASSPVSTLLVSYIFFIFSSYTTPCNFFFFF